MNPLGAIKLKLEEEPAIEPYTLLLSYIPHDKQGQILSVHDLSIQLKLNAPDEISFSSYKYLDKENQIIDPLWDEIEDLKLVYVKELNEYFSIEVTKSDEQALVKNVVGVDAAAMELSQVIMNHNEFNTDEDIAREDYVNPTVFYKPGNPKESLLHRCLEEAPQWSIAYVDNSLAGIQRTFSADNISIYDFLTGDVAEEFHCLFLFDSVKKTVSAYDLDTVCPSCGNRGKFHLVCPKCGSTLLREFGDDTQIYIDVENLANDISYETDVDSIKNCFRIEGGDDLMTATVANLNPNGTNYIYYFSQDALDAMPHLLREKMESYTALLNSYKEQFSQLCEKIYDSIDRINYLQHSMMPSVTKQDTDASTEVRKLTSASLNPCAVNSDPSMISAAVAENSIKNFARAVVNSARFKIEITTRSWSAPNWSGTITLTSYSDKEDTATSGVLSVRLTKDFREYIEQRIEIEGKRLNDQDEYGNIYDVLGINDLGTLKQALTRYSLERLKSFLDAFQEVLDIMIQTDQGREGMELYESHYLPYLAKHQAVEAEITKREADIAQEQANYDNLSAQRQRIQEACNFRNFLGEEMYKTFCAFKREDLYKNNNFKSKGLSNPELVDKADELWQLANDEIIKSGEYQHSISGSLIDFLGIPQFRDFFGEDSFSLGNWINVGIDDEVYRLRLIEIGLDFDSLQTINVTFSDVEKIRDGFDDTRSILAQAKRMGTSFGALQNQVDSNTDAQAYVDDWVGRGLDLTLLTILSDADHQEVKMDDQGLWLRRYDPMIDRYEPEQTRIINNGMYYTSDYWNSLRACLGKFVFPDPRNNFQNTEAYGVLAEMVVGRVVLSEDVGIWTSRGSIVLNENGYEQTVNQSGSEEQTFFKIHYNPSNGDGYDCFIIDPTRFYVNMPGGEIHFDSSNFTVDAADISMNGSTINMDGGEIHMSASGDMKLDAGSNLTLEGTNINMKAAKIDMRGVTTINGAVQIDEDGYLHAHNAEFWDILCHNLTADGKIQITGENEGLLISNETFRFGKNKDEVGIWFDTNGRMTISLELDVGKNGTPEQHANLIVYWDLLLGPQNFGKPVDGSGNIFAAGAAYFNSGFYVGTYGQKPTLLVNCTCSSEGGGEEPANISLTSNASLSRNATMALMPSTTMIDYGTAKIAEDGLCYVYTDPALSGISKSQITPFVQAYSEEDVHIIDVQADYFTVKGAPGTCFGWTLFTPNNGEGERLPVALQDLETVERSIKQADSSITEIDSYVFELLNELNGD